MKGKREEKYLKRFSCELSKPSLTNGKQTGKVTKLKITCIFKKGTLYLQSKYKHNVEHLCFPALNPWCINIVFQRKLQLLLCTALGTEGSCVPSHLIRRTCCTQYVAKASRRGASASHQQQVSSQGNRNTGGAAAGCSVLCSTPLVPCC